MPDADFGETKIEDFHDAVRTDLDVARLEIPVHDAAFVGVIECIGDLPGNADRLIQRQRSLPDTFGESRTFDQFHDKVVGAYIVERGDVRMIQGSDRVCLAREPLIEFFSRYFDGCVARQARIFRAIHFPHASDADGADDFVRTESRARCECHVLVRQILPQPLGIR